MKSLYGNPIPCTPMYLVYAHPSVVTAAEYPVAEPEGIKSKGGGGGGSGDGGKVTSGLADGYGSQSGGDTGSEGSPVRERMEMNSRMQLERDLLVMHLQRGNLRSQLLLLRTMALNLKRPIVGGHRTVSKLPVLAPGRATLPGPATNLNIGIEVWRAPHVGTVPKDERELRREQRKQSNRESARRSRLRKQQECEDLARKVTEPSSENSSLKVELEQLNKACKDLESENASITVDLNRIAKTAIQSQFEGISS